MDIPRVPDIATLHARYRDGTLTPTRVVEALLDRIAAYPDKAVWISLRDRADLLAEAGRLGAAGPSPDQPLWGIPFAVKDNIDLAGLPTTAACPEFAFTPARDATVVARLRAAGAIPLGKTNLDQFATGLNGTRSPHGAPRCVFDPDYVSGGSSSGSAVAVGAGLVPFALGTDTAGSGRVPAAFNNVVGVKPSKGLLPLTGVLPACQSLDCVSVLAATVADADLVRRVAQGLDTADPFSRGPQDRPVTGLRFGVLASADREFFGDAESEALYDSAVARLAALGGTAVPIDYAPFQDCAQLLYGGPWVAERLAAVEGFAASHAESMDPTVRAIILGAKGITAVDAFRGQYRLAELARRTEATWAAVDILLLPTAPTIYRVDHMLADPVRLNGNLGRYTNFVNLLDLAAVAVPAGFRADGLPFGVTLVGPAMADGDLALLADRLHRAGGSGTGVDRTAPVPGGPPPSGPREGDIMVLAVGAHLAGLPLNWQLTNVGGRLLEVVRTAPDYRFYALAGTVPPKPGLVRDPGFQGPGIEGELWSLPAAAFGRFVAAIPGPLGIGKVRLEDGREVSGFLCEAAALDGAKEITALGGWRRYLTEKG